MSRKYKLIQDSRLPADLRQTDIGYELLSGYKKTYLFGCRDHSAR